MSRAWAMPSPDTFSIQPIADFVARWTAGRAVIVDPFARNSMIGTHRNDLDPFTSAQWHLNAPDFVRVLADMGIQADAVLFDPPYSSRQISECYRAAGLEVGMCETQNSSLYADTKTLLDKILQPDGIALSFGWNSCGFGKKLNFEIEEILLVAHGGAHNDTICMVERKNAGLFSP